MVKTQAEAVGAWIVGRGIHEWLVPGVAGGVVVYWLDPSGWQEFGTALLLLSSVKVTLAFDRRFGRAS